ncbi:hypothetical protein NQ314_020884 [Rhamnusium bicolor]|uniref:Peptidase S1 domain-containing protein n=1 Tax=Rhamnusium bicolor TaxID=1586634 RepID=A0AAV8WKL1_9CUCU|nr:hypothetical protein NQ314_020884 [Rhamnusium bicolor]
MKGASAIVYLGAHNVNLDYESTRLITVSYNLIPHENFDGTSIINDIGLIEFPGPIELTDYINTVSLPSHTGNIDDYVGK